MFRLTKELQPDWVVGENVAGHITMGLDTVLSNLESQGYQTRTFVFPAVSVGAPHQRYRTFVVANAGASQNHKPIRPLAPSEADGTHGVILPGGLGHLFPNLTGKYINPQLLEWMMGFPIGWTEV